MSPVARLVSDKEPEQVFISIEDTPIVLADLRRSLPELQEELCRKWPVESVHIHERRPYFKNPLHPSQVVEAACIGLIVVFSSAVLKAAGTKIGDAIGDGVKPFIVHWVKNRFGSKQRHKKLNAKTKRLPTAKERSKAGHRR